MSTCTWLAGVCFATSTFGQMAGSPSNPSAVPDMLAPAAPCPNDFAQAIYGAGGERLSRFVCVSPPEADRERTGTAFRVRFRTLYNTMPGDPDGASVCPFGRASLLLQQFEGQTRWFGEPYVVDEQSTTPTPNYVVVPLVCTAADAHVRDWSSAALAETFPGGCAHAPAISCSDDADCRPGGLCEPNCSAGASCIPTRSDRIFAFDPGVVPCSVYEVSPCTDPLDEDTCAEPVVILTGKLGDCWPPFDPAPGQPSFLDIGAAVNKFKALPFVPGPMPSGAPYEWYAGSHDNVLHVATGFRVSVDFLDVGATVNAFKSYPYLWDGPCDRETASDTCGGPCSIAPRDPAECIVDSDCDDDNPCTDDTCSITGACTFPADDAGTCDNGLFCDGTEECRNGACVSVNPPCGAREICEEGSRSCSPSDDGIVFYVDVNHPQASDTNPGTAALPFRSIQAAANIVQPGDIVRIKGGRYDHGTTQFYTPVVDITRSGVPGSPIRFEAYLDPSTGTRDDVLVDGLGAEYRSVAIRLRNVSHVDLVGLRVTGSVNGIVVDGSTHCTIEHCEPFENAARGMQLINACENLVVQYNDVHHNQYGIRMDPKWEPGNDSTNPLPQPPSPTNCVIQYNYVHDNHDVVTGDEHSDGINIKGESNLVRYNVVAYNGDDGIDLAGSRGGVVYHNIVFGSGKFRDGTTIGGNGNGLKCGTNGGGGHLFAFNVSFDNLDRGGENHHELPEDGNVWFNNVFFGNGRGITTGDDGRTPSVFRNNISFNSILDDFNVSGPLASELNDTDANLFGTSNSYFEPGPDDIVGRHGSVILIQGLDPLFIDPATPNVALAFGDPLFGYAPGFSVQVESVAVDAGHDIVSAPIWGLNALRSAASGASTYLGNASRRAEFIQAVIDDLPYPYVGASPDIGAFEVGR